MANTHLSVLNTAVMFGVDRDNLLRELGKFAAFGSNKGDRVHPVIDCPVNRFDKVRRAAANAEGHDDVAGTGEVLQLANVNILVGIIVSEGGDPTDVAIQSKAS